MSEWINELGMKQKAHKYNDTTHNFLFLIFLKMTFLMVFVSYSQPAFRFHGEVSKPSWMVWLFVTGFADVSNNESCVTLKVLQPWARELYIILYITLLYYNTIFV